MKKQKAKRNKITMDSKDTINIGKLVFHKECEYCPESYNVYKGAKQIAYIRLRLGWLRVCVPDFINGKLIYDKHYKEEYKGCFESNKERMEELIKIAKILESKVC